MADIDIDRLVAQLEAYNTAYRSGAPLVEDATYDRLVERLRALDPQHPFVQSVEPEKFTGRTQVRHPLPMLSTEKAYTEDQLARFVQRVEKEASAIGLAEVQFEATPKLDGLAGRDDGEVLASRGNGLVGFDISNAWAKGVVPVGGRGQGLGEITVVQSYFDAHLAELFEHPRNMVVGVISSDTLNPHARQALEAGMVRFVPYNQLPRWQGPAAELLAQIETISRQLAAQTDYPMDGVVVSACEAALRERMGATSHHYRWQIAVKRKGDTAVTTVENIQWQVGRTGNVTPVLEVAPVALSGATIRRVTAHHAGMVEKLRIGPGARIEVIRSGEVIPKLERVLTPSQQVALPENCPSCGSALTFLKSDDQDKELFLKCHNPACPAQIEQSISHWFRILGNADWFGIKTIRRIVAGGYDSLEKIYDMTEGDFVALGFGPVQSRNLAEALRLSRTQPVEDWRFLAALGIADLGVGDSRKLLQHIPIEALNDFDQASIEKIHGFGEKTSKRIVDGLGQIRGTLTHLLALGFQLERTVLLSESVPTTSPIAGKNLVFTGKMVHGNREQMQGEARRLGANVQTAVSGTTDFLICGEKVGATKRNKAEALGVRILSEADYLQMIAERREGE
ncbi:MAG: DNA ligase [Desulfatitalea sp.]|nr:DNA ligase [Desulfatitalea sp.]